jgi:HSP20 family protein
MWWLEGRSGVEYIPVERLSMLRETASTQRWVAGRQNRIWRPPTDVYETDECIVVKVEIAGMQGDDFSISLDTKRLTIGGVRHDPAEKLTYQQMEIPYGPFETEVLLPRAIDADKIEATYQNGFLIVRLAKAKPRQVPIVSSENA